MFSPYVVMFDREKPDVVIACPACSQSEFIARAQYEQTNWVFCCKRCGGTFGHVSPELFRAYVSQQWSTKKNPEAVYVDVLIVERGCKRQAQITRWHGWVDRASREIVQEG